MKPLLDLDAIRARDAAMPFNDPQSEWDSHARAAWDRRDLLAEVDRLRALLDAEREDHAACVVGHLDERARALPVIEAARRLLRRSGSVLMTDAEQEDWAALRAALAAYEEATRG